MAHSNLFTQQIGGAQGSSAGAGIFRTRERHMLGMPPLEQQIYGGAGRGPEQEPEQLGNPNVMDEVNDMLNYDLIDDLLDFTAAEIESEPFLFDHHTAPKIDEIQVNSTVLPTVDIDPHTLEIPPLENSFRQCDDLNGPGLEWLSNFIDQCCAPLEVGIMMKSADYYSGKASADDGKQISQLPNPSSIPAHQSISNQQRLIDDDKDKDNCIVVENGPPLPPPALPSVSPSSSSSSSMNTGSKAPIIISNSSGIFTTLTNRGRAPRTKRRKFIPKHPLNKRPVDFSIPALECDITEERQSKKLKTVHPSSTSVEINLPPTPSSQPHLVPCQKDEETIRNCSHCRAVVTPQWRAGPMGPKTLCNACGVRYKSGRLFPEYRPSASPTFEESRHSNNHKKVVELRGMNANVAKDVKTPASTKGCELLNYINDGCRK